MSRRHEHDIEIHASVAAVWKALTDAEELTRWFVESARVEPREGGSYWRSWGDGVEADTVIDTWQPRRHLRLLAKPPASDPEATATTEHAPDHEATATTEHAADHEAATSEHLADPEAATSEHAADPEAAATEHAADPEAAATEHAADPEANGYERTKNEEAATSVPLADPKASANERTNNHEASAAARTNNHEAKANERAKSHEATGLEHAAGGETSVPEQVWHLRAEVEPMVEEYLLEDRGETTVLRVVQSSIPDSPDWDGFYEGTRRGWKIAMAALRHSLERHPGQPRFVTGIRLTTALPQPQAWAHATGPDGLGVDGTRGERYRATSSSGAILPDQVPEGQIVEAIPGFAVLASIESLDDALLSLTVDANNQDTMVWMSVSTFGAPLADQADLKRRWTQRLEHALQSAPPAGVPST